MNKPIYRVCSFSGGKDSTAMLLRLLEEGIHIDCILFVDTGLEFPEMYKHIDKVERDIGREITRIRAEHTYEYMMFDIPVKRKAESSLTLRYGSPPTGYGWPGPRQRWCTTRLKDMPREKFLSPLRKKYEVLEYVGIAADEGYRLARIRNQNQNHRHPLVDWGMTEADCLKYCYDRGYDWGGLYEQFKRVSCWCCPLQSLAELRILYANHPDLWAKLKEWDNRTWRKFKADYSVEELEIRFNMENEYVRTGQKINDRAFFHALRERLEAANGKRE